jgi:branched-chain amino acid transport system substrate-binding protein
MPNDSSSTITDRVSRRRTLQAIGAAGISALAGCSNNGDSGGGGGGGGGDGNGGDGDGNGGGGDGTATSGSVDEVTIGMSAPLSGNLAQIGNRLQHAVELAGMHAQQEDGIGSVNVLVEDNQVNPSRARRIAQQQLDNGADVFVAGLDSRVAIAVGQLAAQENVLHFSSDTTYEYSYETCLAPYFGFTKSLLAQNVAPLGYMIENEGTEKIFEIYTDYAFPQSLQRVSEEQFMPNVDAENVGRRAMPLETSDWSPALTAAEEAGADTVNFAMYGADLSSALSQAVEFGYIDNDIKISSPFMDTTFGPAIPDEIQAYDNFFTGQLGPYHMMETDTMQTFRQQYNDQYDTEPSFEAQWYVATRTYLKAAAETGSTDTDTVRSRLLEGEGMDLYPQVYEEGEHFRSCEQRVAVPTQTMTTTDPADVDEETMNYFQILDTNANYDETTFPCEDMACQGQ